MRSDISINDKYKSSVRLDAVTGHYDDFINTLIVHGTLTGTIATIARELRGSAQRAFTITGPYGSGKSTLAGLLSGLVSKDPKHRAKALDKFDGMPELQEAIQKAFPISEKNGWGVVQHVCGLSKPSQAIAKSIQEQLGTGKSTDTSGLSDAQCLELIKRLIVATETSSDGILILLDELGKALDFQANSDGDLYFFQELADIAQQSKVPIVIVGFLHQAFSQYAKGKSALTQQEWAKIQGRYRDLSFNPTVDESLILIGDSISKSKKTDAALSKKYSSLVDHITRSYPKIASSKAALEASLPIDPIVSLLLGPISRRRFSQNERSIFGFLASSERFGFRWFLETDWTLESSPLYGPQALWNYLDANLGHLIASSPDGKAWLEGQDAIHRADQLSTELSSRIATLVALISIFGQSYQLFATPSLIVGYFEALGFKKSEIDRELSVLSSASIIIYRKKHDAFFIFQGSDIDINGLILAEIESIREGVSWAHECETPTHILASSHYHKTGTMRWASTAFIESVSDIDSIKTGDAPKSGEAFTTFVLIASYLNSKALKKLSVMHPGLVIGSPLSIERLKTLAIEVIAIRNIFKREARLAHDHIATKELTARLHNNKQSIADELDLLFTKTSWFHNGHELPRETLSSLASQVAEIIYPNSPIVINELVNRSKPSGSANSATNKLMLAMLNNDSEEDLGFDSQSFPPEKGIYLSVLKSKGWHRKLEFGYGFSNSWELDSNGVNTDGRDLWNQGYKFIKEADGAVTLQELYHCWMSPPFGLTAGLCRIYGLALLKSLEGKVAFYDKDSTQSFIFIPQLDEVIVEKMHKHPHEVAVRYFEIDSVQSNLVRSIATAAELQQRDDPNLLELAKHIVKIVHTLPAWVKKTSGDAFASEANGFKLSKEAKLLRNSALRANDPYKLILEDIPDIFSVAVGKKSTEKNIDKLTVKLKASLDELTSQHTLLIDGFKSIVAQELSANFDLLLALRCDKVANNAHRPAIKEFAKRLSAYVKGKSSFEWVVSTALGIAERNWTDKHINNGLHEIYNLCRQFRREESFSKMTKSVSATSVGLITTDNNGSYIELEGHIAEDSKQNPEITKKVSALSKELTGLSDDAKREVLVQLLSGLMHPIETSLELNNDD